MLSRSEIKIITVGIISFGVVALIGLIYAAFTGQLNITGTSVQRRSTWDIHFENLASISTTGSAKVLSEPSLNGTTSIDDYSVSTTSPGDKISFTFKVVNDGNYDAEISSINIGTPTCTGTDETSNTNVCNKLTYTLTDENGASINVGDKLLAKDSKVMKVTLLYQNFSDASLLPKADVSINGLGLTIIYEQSGSALVKDNGEVANYRVYHQGDKITLNNEDYYVIANSGAGQDYVVALKYLPLTVAEVNLYGGVGTEDNRVNKYAQTSVGTAQNNNGYGVMAYYTSPTCGWINGSIINTGCTADYDQSNIKYVIDAWFDDKFANNELKIIDGYKARLITYNEVVNTLSCQANSCEHSSWVYNSKYTQLTMSYSGQHPLGAACVYFVNKTSIQWDGSVNSIYYNSVIRPVINVYKSAIQN